MDNGDKIIIEEIISWVFIIIIIIAFAVITYKFISDFNKKYPVNESKNYTYDEEPPISQSVPFYPNTEGKE